MITLTVTINSSKCLITGTEGGRGERIKNRCLLDGTNNKYTNTR